MGEFILKMQMSFIHDLYSVIVIYLYIAKSLKNELHKITRTLHWTHDIVFNVQYSRNKIGKGSTCPNTPYSPKCAVVGEYRAARDHLPESVFMLPRGQSAQSTICEPRTKKFVWFLSLGLGPSCRKVLQLSKVRFVQQFSSSASCRTRATSNFPLLFSVVMLKAGLKFHWVHFVLVSENWVKRG